MPTPQTIHPGLSPLNSTNNFPVVLDEDSEMLQYPSPGIDPRSSTSHGATPLSYSHQQMNIPPSPNSKVPSHEHCQTSYQSSQFSTPSVPQTPSDTIENVHPLPGKTFVNSSVLSEEEEQNIIEALVSANRCNTDYKTALDSLAGVNGKPAEVWKDWYLQHHSRFNVAVSALLAGPSSVLPIQQPTASTSLPRPSAPEPPVISAPRPFLTIKKPQFGSPSVTPSPRSRSSSARPAPVSKPKKASRLTRNASTASTAPDIPKKGRKTMNSLTAPAPVFNNTLYIPHSQIVVPEPPSRSPSPPTNIVQNSHGNNKFTPEDHDFFIKFISWRMSRDHSLTRKELMEAIALKAPHHAARSWRSYWSSHHDLPDKIYSHYWNMDTSDESEGEEDQATSDTSDSVSDSDSSSSGLSSGGDVSQPRVRKTKRNPLQHVRGPRPANIGPSNQRTLSPLTPPPDDESDTGNVQDMGKSGEPYTKADFRICAEHIATFDNFAVLSGSQRWDSFCAKGSWGEYYRNNQKGVINDLANKLRRQRQAAGAGKRKATPDKEVPERETKRTKGNI
ncbi:hypothetical protein DL96DRAFT_1575930 [Flagelloscypha sp. PMI_526]|nr:hypothetical protein DL96DRAFT_1575930 [Flagelloscypha sp. PMI_526]